MLNEHTIKRMIELRISGMSTNAIAKELNVSRKSVRYHCTKHNLGGVIAHNPFVDEAYDKFINGFNSRHGDRFIYVSGFKGSESPVLIKCRDCGNKFTRSAQIARKDKLLTCDNCKSLLIKQKAQERETQRETQRVIKEKEKQQSLLIKQQERDKALIASCQECDNTFKANRLGVKYCSDTCKKKHINRVKELKRRKMISINGDIDNDISLERLAKIEHNVCYICSDKCDTNDYTITNEGYFVVGASYPSIEHVIPISKGGTHTWDNVRLAHHYCNTIKSNKDIYKEPNGQLKLTI